MSVRKLRPMGTVPTRKAGVRVRMLLLLALPGLCLLSACGAWRALRQVGRPREGSALNKRVAIVYSSRYQIGLAGLERLHPFDIHKYVHIYTRLVKDGLLKPQEVYVPEPISEEAILRVHTRAFLESLKSSRTVAAYLEVPAVGVLPACMLRRGVLRPFRCATGGTLLAARRALQCGIGVNIGGGYHHAKPDAGEGFCIYADIPIAIRTLQAEGKIRRALVIDLDVHQGNGTAICLADDDETFTFSMHQRDIYPVPKEKSDLDIELEAGADDETFLRILSENLPALFERARPDIVFLVAGCDTLAGDPLASLKMTEKGIVRRDMMVIGACVRRGTPVVMTLGGGYSANAWRAQYASVRGIIQTWGDPRQTAASRRN